MIIDLTRHKLGDGKDKTLFEFSFNDLDFENEITTLSDTYSSPASHTYQTANSVNTIRGWGLVRVKDNKTPKADPGAPELLKKYNSIYVADTDSPVIYLTFDEGYEAGFTPDILDCLKNIMSMPSFYYWTISKSARGFGSQNGGRRACSGKSYCRSL